MGSQIGKNGVSRRSFLAASGVAALGAAGLDLVREAEAGNAPRKDFRVIDTHPARPQYQRGGPGGFPLGRSREPLTF